MDSRQKVRQGHNPLVFDGASRPAQGYFAHHIGFTMRTVSYTPPPETIRFHDDSEFSPMPRALRSKWLDMRGNIPGALFKSVNSEVEINYLRIQEEGKTDRMISVDGDQVWFVHTGRGVCESVIGIMAFEAPSYIFIPRSFTYRIHAATETFLIGMESADSLRKPKFTWLNDTVPFSEHNLITPDPIPFHAREGMDGAVLSEPYWSVSVKRAGKWSRVLYSHRPFACIGYQGHPYPFVLATENISLPTLSKEHTDPTSFMTFASSSSEAPSVGISTFLPHRPHSLPYYHTNTYDEILFLARTYAPREGVLSAGDMSFHPQGFPHGPQTNAMDEYTGPKQPEEAHHIDMLAIMFESQSPLIPTKRALGVEILDYWQSWGNRG